MKVTKKYLQKLIKEEVKKLVSELESTTLRHDREADQSAGSPKTAGRGIEASGHVDALEEIIARLSRIEGKIDLAAGNAPRSTAS